MPHRKAPEKDTVMATVYLRSASGKSLLQIGRAGPMDVGPYRPAEASVARATGELTRRGFTVEAIGLTLSISGPRELFERECGVILTRVESRLEGERPIRFWQSSRPVMQIAGLEDVIEGITLATPAAPLSP